MTLLRSTETGYLLTTTRQEDAGPVLRRRAGPLREHDLAPPAAAAEVGALKVVGLDWSLPVVDDDALAHALPGEASVAALMLAGMPGPALARMVAPVGAGFAAVHRLDAAAGVEPAGLRRLSPWLVDGRGPGHAARLRAVLDEHAGLVDVLTGWIEDLRAAPAGLLLGAPGTNTLYPHPDGARTTVLVTDELADGPTEWDLGWLLGELLELANDPHLTSGPVSLAGHPVADVVLTGYGDPLDHPLDRGRVARAAVLRWVVHLHDYASYVDWADDLPARIGRVAALSRDPAVVLGPA